jgi:hypothetical protein
MSQPRLLGSEVLVFGYRVIPSGMLSTQFSKCTAPGPGTAIQRPSPRSCQAGAAQPRATVAGLKVC